MKKVILSIVFVFVSFLSYSQDFKGLGGYLRVDNGYWSLTWQNNNYKILTDLATLQFSNKSEVEQFYNDLTNAIESDKSITREKYRIHSDGNIVLVYNTDEQYTTLVKKYSKKGLSEIKESINYMKN
jgi:hypothetical protein